MRRQTKTLLQAGIAIGGLLLIHSPSKLSGQAPIPVPQPVQTAPVAVPAAALLAPGQLENLVAPIALYPDPLLSQVLIAATYPLEVVQAYQWVQQNPGLAGPALTQAADQQNWDASVQALVMFPDVLKLLNDDINWTTTLGNAFLAQSQDVMNAVQRLRLQSQQAGSLVSTPQQQVITTTEAGQPVVIIEPANPSVVYVPYYDPVWFWGPAAYYPYPRWHYPVRTSGFFFGFGHGVNVGAFLGAGWGGWNTWGWVPAWHDRTIIVNNTFIRGHNFNAPRTGAFNGTTVWSHDAFHRHGVPYPAPALTQRYRGNVQENLRRRPEAEANLRAARPVPAPAPAPAPLARTPAARGFRSPAPAPTVRAPREEMGNRQVQPNAPFRNRSAFGGIENGDAARSHINRGYNSLGPGHAPSPGSAPSGNPGKAPSGNPGRGPSGDHGRAPSDNHGSHRR